MRFRLSLAVAAVLGLSAFPGAGPLGFYPDDPIARFPEPADASGVKPRPASQGFDFVENSFMQPGERAQRKDGNVNTLDEVPDSSWFTNRMGSRPMSLDEMKSGPDRGGPAPGTWKLVRGDATGVTPGFRILDSNGQLFFIKVDQPKNPELSTGAEVVSTKLFHALGYNVPENYIVSMSPENVDLSEAQITGPDGRRRRMTRGEFADLLEKAARSKDGTYRVIASKGIAGSIIGPFRYYGTVPDDPNDIVPHEHRRELRAVRVFGAWVNHMDSRGINSLDTLVDAEGGKRVKHYLIDFGSTLGSAAITVKSRRSGNAYLYDFGDGMKTMLTFGLYVPSWAFIDFPVELPSVGRIEGDAFNPEKWVPHYPNPAFDNARADDTFWAARRVMAFSNEAIRALVEQGQYSDPKAAEYLTEVLIKRRNKIGAAWLTKVTPLVDFRVDGSGKVTFANAAVDAGVAEPPREYQVSWGTFDNATGVATPVGSSSVTTATSTTLPATLMDRDYVRLEVSAVHDKYPNWKEPVRVTFRREQGNWKTVGLERMREPSSAAGSSARR
jgi:hypothetical protein